MTNREIRQTIAQAIAHENRTGQLREQLHRNLDQLRMTLLLPEERPVAALMAFITRYIESVPSSLKLASALAKQMGFHAYVAPFLHLAEDYFLQPPQVLTEEEGLGGLLDEAFLAHRLLEELNDHHIRNFRRPLLPLDMTESNIIVHHLIGDKLASSLDALVHYATMELLEAKGSWEPLGEQKGAVELPERITLRSPIVSERSEVRLRVDSAKI